MASYKCRQSKLCLFKCKLKMTIHGVPFQPKVYNQMNARFFLIACILKSFLFDGCHDT